MKFARACRVEKIIRPYLEALLNILIMKRSESNGITSSDVIWQFRGGFWFFPNYSTSRGSVTNLIPSRISRILLADRVPIGSPSWLLSTVNTCETMTTLCLGRFVSFFSRSTLPGALSRLRLDVRGHTTTVRIRLWLKRLFWIITCGCRYPGSDPRISSSSTQKISPCLITIRPPRGADAVVWISAGGFSRMLPVPPHGRHWFGQANSYFPGDEDNPARQGRICGFSGLSSFLQDPRPFRTKIFESRWRSWLFPCFHTILSTKNITNIIIIGNTKRRNFKLKEALQDSGWMGWPASRINFSSGFRQGHSRYEWVENQFASYVLLLVAGIG